MTVQKQGERKVFHLLHGKPPGVAKTRPLHDDERKGRPSASDVVVLLPLEEGDEGILIRGIDPRDERTLIVWDGALLPNGLPRGSTILLQALRANQFSRPKDGYRVPWGQAYKKRETDPEGKLFLPWSQEISNGITVAQFGVQEIHRYFVLMGTNRTATVLRFDDKRLAPRYVFVEVEKGGKSVRWRQSSY